MWEEAMMVGEAGTAKYAKGAKEKAGLLFKNEKLHDRAWAVLR
jgi:hypothetical protein